MAHVPGSRLPEDSHEDNPWFQKSFMRAARVMTRVDRAYREVDPQMIACTCGGQMWWQATANGYTCTTCRRINFTTSEGRTVQ